MWNHEPPGYACPFCLLQRGVNNDRNQADVHVFPRYDGDRLYERQREAREASAHERKPYAARLAAAFAMPRTFG